MKTTQPIDRAQMVSDAAAMGLRVETTPEGRVLGDFDAKLYHWPDPANAVGDDGPVPREDAMTMTKVVPNLTLAQAAKMTAAEVKAHDISWLESRRAHAQATGEGYPVETLERWLEAARAAQRDPIAACCDIANDPKRHPAARRAAEELVLLYELFRDVQDHPMIPSEEHGSN